MIINLTNAEMELAEATTKKLCAFYDNQDFEQTFEGLAAELAVIKYFNVSLGAKPAVEFNTEYNFGGDGGFDFKCPDSLKWDVKSVLGKGLLLTKLAKKTKANVIVLVRRSYKAENSFKVIGFLPVSRLPDTETIPDSLFRDLAEISAAFPERFTGEKIINNLSDAVIENGPMKVGRIIDRIVRFSKVKQTEVTA